MSAPAASPQRPASETVARDAEDSRQEAFSARHLFALILSTLVLGVLVGTVAGCLGKLLGVFEGLMLGYHETGGSPIAWNSGALRRFLSVSVGGLVVAIAWYFLRNKTTKVPSVAKAVKGARLPWWQTLVHDVLQIFYVGSGGSIGREVAPREAGSMLSQYWWEKVGLKIGLRCSDLPLFTAAGAGAGFAGVYISPLAGAFFGIEMLLGQTSFEVVGVCLGMSSISTLVGGMIMGTHPYYSVGHENFPVAGVIIALILAPLTGFVGGWFRWLTSRANKKMITDKRILFALPLTAVLTGAIAAFFPQIMGNGRALAQSAMNVPFEFLDKVSLSGWLAVLGLLGLAALKMAVTLLTIRAGASGGTLTPAISIGACTGAALGVIAQMIAPGFIPVWQCAMIGAVAVLASAQKAPLMATAMIIEISHLPVSLIAPFGIAVGGALAISRIVVEGCKAKTLK